MKQNEPKYPLAPPESSDDRFYVNYATRKNIAQGMMDVSLLTANASQLRYIMRAPYWDIYHKVNFGLITFNIILQVRFNHYSSLKLRHRSPIRIILIN